MFEKTVHNSGPNYSHGKLSSKILNNAINFKTGKCYTYTCIIYEKSNKRNLTDQGDFI